VEKPTTPKKPRKKRRSDPLKKKSPKPEVIKNLDEINKLSKGTELLRGLKDTPKDEEVILIDSPIEIEQSVPEDPENTNEDHFNSMIQDGVEVVDVKAIERKKKLET
jgi:hypothetical protein